MKTDKYEELEGKIIDCYNEGIHKKGRVVGCDPDIGITIVDKDDPNDYLLCLIGPSSPLWIKNNEGYCKKRHKILFEELVDQIKKGKHDWPETKKLWSAHFKKAIVGKASAEFCAFGQ